MFCDGCALGKSHRLPYCSRLIRANVVGYIIRTDVCGPMPVATLAGSKYFVLFKDGHSHFRAIYFIREKCEVIKYLKEFLNKAKTQGHIVKVLQSDNGGEFDNQAVRAVLAEYGIEQRLIAPYAPQQNGAVERDNRTINDLATTMMQTCNVPKTLWAEACATAVYSLNHTGRSSIKDKAPAELWYGWKLKKLDHLRVFVTECYTHVPKSLRKKFDAKSMLGIFVEYINEFDGYRIWVPTKHRIVLSHDVMFKPKHVYSSPSMEVIESGAERIGAWIRPGAYICYLAEAEHRAMHTVSFKEVGELVTVETGNG